MPRTIHDVTDIAHGWLLGATCAYTVWAYANRAVYGSGRLSRMNLVICSVLIVRILTTIRLETTNQPLCSLWIFLRSVVTGFVIYGLNVYFITELFLNLAVGVSSKPGPEKRLWRRTIHGFTQALNFSNGIQHATNVIAVITDTGVCIISGRRDSKPLAWLTMATFFICLGMTLSLALSKSMFSSTVPEVTRLFRLLTVSSTLLCIWVSYAQIDIVYGVWEDWKSFNMTIAVVWMTVNSIIANNYLIRVKTRSNSLVRPSSNASEAKADGSAGSHGGGTVTIKTSALASDQIGGHEGSSVGRPRGSFTVSASSGMGHF